MPECAFCRIAAGEADAFRLYEDARTVAFLDRDPATRGHSLVIPWDHRESLFRGGDPTATEVYGTVERVVAAMHRTLEPDGVSVFYTSGDLAGNVTHAHVHVLPRWADDDITVALDRHPLDAEEADRLAARIRDDIRTGDGR